MTPMESTMRRLDMVVQAERQELDYISGSLRIARVGHLSSAAAHYEQRYCRQLDRVWDAQERLKAFNPSFTMVSEPA